MDRVVDMNRAREIVANRDLWPKVRDFLWDFAQQVHESWLEDFPVDVDRGSSRVRAWMLSQLGVGACFFDFSKDGWSRLPLLNGTTLESIVKWLGALACEERLRRVTGSAAVKELRTNLSGVYPEVFGFSIYFKDLKPCVEIRAGQSLSDFVIEVGCSILLEMVSDLPKDVLLRLRMKLPKVLSEVKPSALKHSSVNLSLLLKLKFPEAYKLCCS